MLIIDVPETELWDSGREEFRQIKACQLKLEHSLVSLSKWEEKYHKPYFSKEKKTNDEVMYYIQCMTITQNVNPLVYNCLTNDNIKSIHEYIEDPMTATRVPKRKATGAKEQVTNELIYYWMISLNIPTEFQKWHLNKLIALIELCNYKNTPPKKTSKKELISKYAYLNAKRRAELHSNG